MAAPSLMLREVRSNTRLRWGLWVIAAVLWFYGILVLQEKVASARQAYGTALRNQNRVLAILQEADWPRRREEASKRLRGMEQRLWRASNPGLAQAAIQDWLGNEILAVGMAIPTLNVTIYQDPTDTGKQIESLGLWKVSARLTGKLSAENLATLLGEIESEPRQLVVETLKIRGSDASLSVEMQLAAYFLPVATGEAVSLRSDANPSITTVRKGRVR